MAFDWFVNVTLRAALHILGTKRSTIQVESEVSHRNLLQKP